jgi:hypothetical protein
MKKTIALLSLLFIVNISFAQHENHTPKVDTTKAAAKPKSPKMAAMAMVGANHVHIDYGSPSVRGRQIWNGLVAYNQVWSAGAHKATWIDFGQDVMIAGKEIQKGKYGFFAIPNKKTWTLILSKTWDMHLADDYKPENDAIRIIVKPKKNKTLVEALTYEVTAKNDNKGNIKLSWENLNVSFDFVNK